MPDQQPSPRDVAARPHGGFARVLHRGVPLALRVKYEGSDFGSSGPYMADTFGRTAAVLCVLEMRGYPSANGWCNGRHVVVPHLPRGSFMLLDLRHTWQTEVSTPFDSLHLNVTQASLDALAEECETPTVDLTFAPFATLLDEPLRHLMLSIVPSLQRPDHLSALYAEHIALAAALHLLQTCCDRRDAGRRLAGGLAPWQEKCAREYLRAFLDSDVDLQPLAAECGLSPGHFAKAFKRSVGMPPHRWLLKLRVEHACHLLLHSNERLEAIALACGFADQSHLSRVFSKALGVSPGAWRRAHRS